MAPHTKKKKKRREDNKNRETQQENPFAHKNSMDVLKPSIYFNGKV